MRRIDDFGAKDQDYLGANGMYVTRPNGNMQCTEIDTKIKIT